MTKRKTISKGTRFDIFKRDKFTCQYCGRVPPDVVLEIDHILPVAEGGDNDEMNLLTACEDCNQGKGKKRLDIAPRPDADLAWLEMQQEIAELRRYQEAKTERDEYIANIVDQLQETWCDYSGFDWAPADNLIRKMLMKHDIDRVEMAIKEAAVKTAGGYIRGKNGWLPYAWGILRNMEREQ